MHKAQRGTVHERNGSEQQGTAGLQPHCAQLDQWRSGSGFWLRAPGKREAGRGGALCH